MEDKNFGESPYFLRVLNSDSMNKSLTFIHLNLESNFFQILNPGIDKSFTCL